MKSKSVREKGHGGRGEGRGEGGGWGGGSDGRRGLTAGSTEGVKKKKKTGTSLE